MSSLSFIERQQLERLLGMESGYVLDFNDRSFAAMFRDFGIDMEGQKYHKNGRSKAKRMRAFWELEDDRVVGKVLAGLLDYIGSTEEGAVSITEAHRQIVSRLMGTPTQPVPVSETDFLEEDFGELNLDRLDLDAPVKRAVEQRLSEVKRCIKNGAPLAAILLCGSTLEGIFLNLATRNPRQFNSAKAAPKFKGKVAQFQNWRLGDFINVAHELGFIQLDVKKFSESLRDFRNFIHPFQQISTGFDPSDRTAQISWQVLCAAIADICGTRR